MSVRVFFSCQLPKMLQYFAVVLHPCILSICYCQMGNVITVKPAPPPGSELTAIPSKDGVTETSQQKAIRVSDCMLEQYMGTAAGVGIGLALGIQRKNIRPFVVAITLGTVADYLHGYYGPCREFREDYELSMKVAKASEESKNKLNHKPKDQI